MWWVIAIAVLVFFGLLSRAAAYVACESRDAEARSGNLHHWSTHGAAPFVVNVVGVEHYASDASGLLALDGEGAWKALPFKALLKPLDDNEHDKNAIAVYINGRQVGHLGRDDAQIFRARLRKLGKAGASSTCDAEVRGGRGSNGTVYPAHVRLNLDPF